MKKFLNFSTILFSYVLITVLVISCGGSSGGGGGTGGSSVGDATNGNGGNGGDATDDTGGVLPQPEPKDDCLLADRPDKDSLAAVLCYEGELFATIEKDTAEPQQLDFVIDSVDNPGVTPSRTWNVSKTREIQISYATDYTLTVNGSIGDIAQAVGHTAEFPLQNLTIASLLTENKDALRSGGISFSQTSGSSIQVEIAPKLSVKTQEDFISMANVALAGLTSADYKVPFVLENDLNLVAPGGEGAKFNSAIIAEAAKAFDFDGGGYRIILNSAIDTLASEKPAAIIDAIQKPVTLQNFTLDVNQSISGNKHVGTLLAGSVEKSFLSINDIKININSDINFYNNAGVNTGTFGGAVGNGCVDANNVVIKTAKDVAMKINMQPDVAGLSYVGGAVGAYGVGTHDVCDNFGLSAIKNNVVDVKIEVVSDSASGDFSKHLVQIGGFSRRVSKVPEVNNNLVKLSISRGNIPAEFAFELAVGFVGYFDGVKEVANNLVYADFSNLGKVKSVAGLLSQSQSPLQDDSIENNMVFIADGFNASNVTKEFGVAKIASFDNPRINNSFFSSPVTDYTRDTLASFVHAAYSDMLFSNLILDNKDATFMFKTGFFLSILRSRVGLAKLSTLTEGANSTVATTLKASDSWEAGIQSYPQLKAPSDLTESVTKAEIEAAWTETNDLIQAGLADRAARASQ